MLSVKFMRRSIFLVVTTAGLTLAGCGASTTTDASDIDPDFLPPDAGTGTQLSMIESIVPGSESLRCQYFVLQAKAFDVVRFDHKFSIGAHHVAVYPTDLTAADVKNDRSPFDCGSRGALHQQGVIYASSTATGNLPYPRGIGMPFAASTVVMLESHYLNTSDQPIDIAVRLNLTFSERPVAIQAGALFFYNWAILVPPAPAVASAKMSCVIPADIDLAFATSHMHRRGQAFTSNLRHGGTLTPLHNSAHADVPTPNVFAPLAVHAGDAIEFSCDYKNDRSEPTIEGASADANEMCIFGGGYWPKQPAATETCLTEGSGPVFSGSKTCAQTVNCMLAAGVGNELGGQQCSANTCSSSAPALSRFIVCVDKNNCWGNSACVAAHCPSQWSSCESARC
jgi:hypothetical protein